MPDSSAGLRPTLHSRYGTRPTMKDVAARAGVGLKTVSRVVNGEPGVTPDTEARVRQAIDALGFRRNDSARVLRKGRTASIGLVLEDLADPFYSPLSRAVEEVARANGSLLFTGSSAEVPDREQELVLALCARRVDGLVVIPASDDHRYLEPEIAAGRGHGLRGPPGRRHRRRRRADRQRGRRARRRGPPRRPRPPPDRLHRRPGRASTPPTSACAATGRRWRRPGCRSSSDLGVDGPDDAGAGARRDGPHAGRPRAGHRVLRGQQPGDGHRRAGAGRTGRGRSRSSASTTSNSPTCCGPGVTVVAQDPAAARPYRGRAALPPPGRRRRAAAAAVELPTRLIPAAPGEIPPAG